MEGNTQTERGSDFVEGAKHAREGQVDSFARAVQGVALLLQTTTSCQHWKQNQTLRFPGGQILSDRLEESKGKSCKQTSETGVLMIPKGS